MLSKTLGLPPLVLLCEIADECEIAASADREELPVRAPIQAHDGALLLKNNERRFPFIRSLFRPDVDIVIDAARGDLVGRPVPGERKHELLVLLEEGGEHPVRFVEGALGGEDQDLVVVGAEGHLCVCE